MIIGACIGAPRFHLNAQDFFAAGATFGPPLTSGLFFPQWTWTASGPSSTIPDSVFDRFKVPLTLTNLHNIPSASSSVCEIQWENRAAPISGMAGLAVRLKEPSISK